MPRTKKTEQSAVGIPVYSKKAKRYQSTPKANKAEQKTRGVAQLVFYNLFGKEEKKTELPKEISDIKTSPKLLAQYIRVYLANQRQGTASTKTRGEVIGSTRKIYKQKGTGRARHGDIKAPIFVGGGVVGGPKPKDFSLKMSKKQKKKALIIGLSIKYKEGNILGLVDNALKIEPKTKIFKKLLEDLKLNREKILLILPKLKEKNLIFAVRNIPNVTLCKADSVNPYILLNNRKVIFLESAFDAFINHFLKSNEN